MAAAAGAPGFGPADPKKAATSPLKRAEAWFSRNRTAALLGGAGVVGGVALYMRHASAQDPANIGGQGAQTAGTTDAAGYDSTAYDVYDALEGQLGAIAEKDATANAAQDKAIDRLRQRLHNSRTAAGRQRARDRAREKRQRQRINRQARRLRKQGKQIKRLQHRLPVAKHRHPAPRRKPKAPRNPRPVWSPVRIRESRKLNPNPGTTPPGPPRFHAPHDINPNPIRPPRRVGAPVRRNPVRRPMRRRR